MSAAPEVREVALAWLLVRRVLRLQPERAPWLREMPAGLRESLDRLLAAYESGRLGSPPAAP